MRLYFEWLRDNDICILDTWENDNVMCFVICHSSGDIRSDFLINIKDDLTLENKHELLQYSIKTNNSQVSRITYPRKMHALYEKRV